MAIDVKSRVVVVGRRPGAWIELLVPFDGTRGAEKVLRRACRAARHDDHGLDILCLVRLPLDEAAWDDPDLDRTAMDALARAQAICREEGAVGVFTLTYARDPVGAIFAKARRGEAALICMSLDEYDEHELGETARHPWHGHCDVTGADWEMRPMKPPYMFAGIVLVIFVVFLLAIAFWTGAFPGPHLTSNPAMQP